MAQGIRTINGYTNNYPTFKTGSTAPGTTTGTWAIGTGVWNTTYMDSGTPTAVTITIPDYTVTNGTAEIRIVFKAGTDCTFTPTINSAFTTQYGVSDISITAGNTYEISFVPLTASILSVVCKEWS